MIYGRWIESRGNIHRIEGEKGVKSIIPFRSIPRPVSLRGTRGGHVLLLLLSRFDERNESGMRIISIELFEAMSAMSRYTSQSRSAFVAEEVFLQSAKVEKRSFEKPSLLDLALSA